MTRALPFALSSALLALAGCARDIPLPVVPGTSDLARGRYLATAGMVCVACHSPRDWTRFGGPVLEGREFTGSPDFSREQGFPDAFRFGAAALTPHGLGAWSDAEVARAVLLGQRNDRRGLFPVMPYRLWREEVPLADAAAVIAWLRTLPAGGEAMPDRKFPMPGFVVDRMPEARPLKAEGPAPESPGYGAYVAARGACQDCHTRTDERGKKVGEPWAGGREFRLPPPAKGVVRSSNLTPDAKTGLGAWTKEQFVQRFRAATLARARETPVEPTGFQTPMPWWAYADLTEEDLGALYDYLRSLPSVENAVVRHTP